MSPIFGILFLVLGVLGANLGLYYYPVDINDPTVQSAWKTVIDQFNADGYGDNHTGLTTTLVAAQYMSFGQNFGGIYRLYYTLVGFRNTSEIEKWTIPVQHIRNEFLIGTIDFGWPGYDVASTSTTTTSPQTEPGYGFASISPSDSSVASAFDAVQTDLLFKVISLMGRGSTVSLSEPTEARNKISGLDTDSTTVWLINFNAERENEPTRNFVAAIVNDPTSQVEYNLLDVVDSNEIDSFVANYPVYL